MCVFKRSLGVLVVSVVALASQALASDIISMTVSGKKQGPLKGDSANRIQLMRINYDVRLPTKSSSGGLTVSGIRTHTPITVTKSLGAASPQLFLAMLNNESLSTVEIDVTRSGTTTAYYKITLLNAQISEIHMHNDSTAPSSPATVEDVSFLYEKMTVLSVASNLSASDVPARH
jgi:type VI secretion system secreted protein Hcp